MVWATIMIRIPLSTINDGCDDSNLRLDSDAPKAARQARVIFLTP